jgi:hypothetical protein
MSEYFGEDWAPSYAKDIVHAELGGHTVEEALAIGTEPSDIWRAICRHNPDVPKHLI